MPRHQFTREERSRGSKNQPREAKVEAGKRGFEVTMERHPWMYARLKYAPGMRRYKEGKFSPHGRDV